MYQTRDAFSNLQASLSTTGRYGTFATTADSRTASGGNVMELWVGLPVAGPATLDGELRRALPARHERYGAGSRATRVHERAVT